MKLRKSMTSEELDTALNKTGVSKGRRASIGGARSPLSLRAQQSRRVLFDNSAGTFTISLTRDFTGISAVSPYTMHFPPRV